MIYELGECSYCSNSYSITRPTPFMADVPSMMCKQCWDDTQEEYANCNGEHIGNFGDADGYKETCKKELKEISKEIGEQRDIADLFVGIESNEECVEFKKLAWLESLYSFKYQEMECNKSGN